MGELVAGTPALRLATAVSLPLDLVSILSLLYRAVPGSELDPWLIATRRTLPPALRRDLDLLHGFSGRLLYYVEEPVMRFEPLRADRLDAGFDDLLAFLQDVPPLQYQTMVEHALDRVHRDLGLDFAVPNDADEAGWHRALEPALTTAATDEVLPLIADPDQLKERTVGLFAGIWEEVYRNEYENRRSELDEAARLGTATADRGLGLAFADLTGSRPPTALVAGLADVERVTFCPSAHLGTFVSYILYPPDLVVFFGARELINRVTGAADAAARPIPAAAAESTPLAGEILVELLRALADPTRLRILDLLAEGELYAQEIVGRLGIAQSAVSRHLAQLERVGLVGVRAYRGSKYYAVNPDRLAVLAEAIRLKGDTARARRS